jgi:cbb3-type cytochrome oxidase maturation protein
MSVIILLIIISIVVALGFLAIFIWAVKTGQFDDTVSPGIRILFDDKKQDTPKTEPEDEQKPSS